MRIYYIGGEDGHTDRRLAGVVLNYGDAVDVHDDKLVRKLLKLRHFAEEIGPAQVVEDTRHEKRAVMPARAAKADDAEPDGATEG